MYSSLKCRGHAGCSCTYQITTSCSDKHSPPCTSHYPPTPAHIRIQYRHRRWSSVCPSSTTADVVFAMDFQRAAPEPTASSAALLTPQRQYPLSSSAFPPPALTHHFFSPSPGPLASDFCSYVTHVSFIAYSLFHFFLSFSEAASKPSVSVFPHTWTHRCLSTPRSVFVSFFSSLPKDDMQTEKEKAAAIHTWTPTHARSCFFLCLIHSRNQLICTVFDFASYLIKQSCIVPTALNYICCLLRLKGTLASHTQCNSISAVSSIHK